MSYGYGDWNSGTSRGYEGYSYGYGYSQESSGAFGYGNCWELGGSEPDGAPDGGDGAGKPRGEPGTGIHPESEGRGNVPDRFEPYGDSRSSSDRDPYRASFSDYRDYPGDYPDYPSDYPADYPDYHPDYPNDYHPADYPEYPADYPADYRDYRGEAEPDAGDFYGRRSREQQPQFPGQFRPRERPWPCRGLWGDSRGGSRRLPSLFSHNILPEPPFRAFPGAFRGVKRPRRGWKMWEPEFRPQRKRQRRDSFGKRRKLPDKAPGTDGSENSSSDNEEGTEGESGEKEESRGEGEDEEGRDSEKGALSTSEENSQLSQLRQKLQPGRKSQERQKKRHRDRMVERIQFVCSLCKFRTFYEDEIQQHLSSKFHQEHFQFVGTRLPQQTADFLQFVGTRLPQHTADFLQFVGTRLPQYTADFLQEYVANKTRKTEERRRGIRDINAVIQQIQREQDLTQEVGLEHFLRKVEAAHCSACDLLIPMHFGAIQKHLKSLDHNHNRRAMMEQSKKSSLVVARSILNNKLISKKLEKYLKGENPFTDDAEEGEGAGEENPEENLENPPNPEENPEENPQNPEENPQNPEENSQNLENSKNPEENSKIPEENSQNPEENSKNLEENSKNPEENSKNPEENPPNLKENSKNLEENSKNPQENPPNPEDPEENPPNPVENPKETQNPEEIPAAENQERGTGTNAEAEKAGNSPNPEEFPEEFPREEQQDEEESSGMFQE